MQFFREVDRQVYAVLTDEDRPLVLACVGFLASLYESVNSYRHIMRTKIPGSPDSWSEGELLAKAYKIAQPELDQHRQQARQAYDDASSTQFASNSIDQIVRAADQGLVSTLFANTSIECPGSYDAEHRLVRHNGRSCNDDLINIAASKTLQNGGTVFELEDEPSEPPLAATFRYALPPEMLGIAQN